jgi:hypothetical protein
MVWRFAPVVPRRFLFIIGQRDIQRSGSLQRGSENGKGLTLLRF